MAIYQYREQLTPKREGLDYPAYCHLGLWDSKKDISIYDFRCPEKEATYLLADRLKGDYDNMEWDVIRIGRTDNFAYENNRRAHTGLLSGGTSLSPPPLTLSEIVQISEKQKTLPVYRRWDGERKPFSAVYVSEFNPIICRSGHDSPQEIFDILRTLAEEVNLKDSKRVKCSAREIREYRRVSNYIKRFLAVHTFTDDIDALLEAATL